ncbi:hypothetical protein GCM10023188_43740 [Pontibacter saemangeumensis]|uniref:Outer membrane protein beta-barrel domain-containing protein n=1 Tax=Pontibacter saemangeumensis TaxID=1084525 RepID=A0ABP8M5E3_9BACT
MKEVMGKFTTVCACLVFYAFQAQQVLGQAQVRGLLVEAESKPLSFANALLLQAGDSALVKGAITDMEGRYSFDQVAPGSYIIKASMVGYKPAFSPAFTVAGTDFLVPGIGMTQDALALGEVTVEATRPLYEQQIDRLVVNVQSSITAAGATALEVLERSPGIAIDRQNSALSMNGKSGVQVMVDGKLSRLPSAAVLQMLEGLTAANIEKIELITTPSARYDAEGNAGMINIVLREHTGYGTNGSLSATAGYGRYGKYVTSLSLNHRTQRLNLFGDYSWSHNHNWNELGNIRAVTDQGTTTHTSSVSDSPYKVINHTSRVGFDYSVSPRTVLGGMVSGFSNKTDTDALNTIQIQEGQKPPTLIAQHTREINRWRHLMANLSIKHSLGEKQHIDIDLDYLLYDNASPAAYDIHYRFQGSGETAREEIRVDKATPMRIGVAKADYTYTTADNTKIETGAKATFTRLDNEVAVERGLQESWVRDAQLSQEIDMSEDIVAAYANLNLQGKYKTSLQAGLRWEYTFTNINSPDQKNLVLRSYHNLFPSLFLSRELNGDNSLQFSYSRRITRPTFNNLVPFVSFKDPYSLWSGNEALKPTITDAVQAGYQLKGKYMLSLQASHDRDAINWMVRLNPGTNIQNVYIANVDRNETYSLNLSLPFTVASWWQMQYNLAAVWQQSRTAYEGMQLKTSGRYGRMNATQTFKLPADFSMELTGFYQIKALFGMFEQTSTGAVNFGVQKKLEKERGAFDFSISDIFWTNRFRIKLAYPSANLDQVFFNIHEPRVIRLTYTRNLGDKNVKAATKRETGSEDERSRVGN